MTFFRHVSAVAAFAVAAFTPIAAAARQAAEFFADAPKSVIAVFDKNSRLDMIDYFNAGVTDRGVRNVFENDSRITDMTDRMVSVQLTPSSSLTLAVVPLKSDSLIAVIETVLTPVPDSSVRFYKASDWTAVSASVPGLNEFIDSAKRKKAPDAELPPYAFATITYDPEANVFVFTNTTDQYYISADRPDGLDLLYPMVPMRFDGRKWTVVKSYSPKGQ